MTVFRFLASLPLAWSAVKISLTSLRGRLYGFTFLSEAVAGRRNKESADTKVLSFTQKLGCQKLRVDLNIMKLTLEEI